MVVIYRVLLLLVELVAMEYVLQYHLFVVKPKLLVIDHFYFDWISPLPCFLGFDDLQQVSSFRNGCVQWLEKSIPI